VRASHLAARACGHGYITINKRPSMASPLPAVVTRGSRAFQTIVAPRQRRVGDLPPPRHPGSACFWEPGCDLRPASSANLRASTHCPRFYKKRLSNLSRGELYGMLKLSLY